VVDFEAFGELLVVAAVFDRGDCDAEVCAWVFADPVGDVPARWRRGPIACQEEVRDENPPLDLLGGVYIRDVLHEKVPGGDLDVVSLVAQAQQIWATTD